MKVIFLDIDGVLASFDYIRVTAALNMKHSDKYGYDFDPRCILNLKLLIEETESLLVISSFWKSMGIQKLKDMWEIRNLPGRIIDITPTISNVPNPKRGSEIKEWLSENKDVTTYVILDDDSDMLEEQEKHFVKTQSNIGLTYDDVCKAISVLGKK